MVLGRLCACSSGWASSLPLPLQTAADRCRRLGAFPKDGIRWVASGEGGAGWRSLPRLSHILPGTPGEPKSGPFTALPASNKPVLWAMDMKDGWSTQAAHLPFWKSEGESAREGALLWPDSSFSWGQILIHRLWGGQLC